MSQNWSQEIKVHTPQKIKEKETTDIPSSAFTKSERVVAYVSRRNTIV